MFNGIRIKKGPGDDAWKDAETLVGIGARSSVIVIRITDKGDPFQVCKGDPVYTPVKGHACRLFIRDDNATCEEWPDAGALKPGYRMTLSASVSPGRCILRLWNSMEDIEDGIMHSLVVMADAVQSEVEMFIQSFLYPDVKEAAEVLSDMKGISAMLAEAAEAEAAGTLSVGMQSAMAFVKAHKYQWRKPWWDDPAEFAWIAEHRNDHDIAALQAELLKKAITAE